MDASKYQNLDNVPEELRRIPYWFLPAHPGNTVTDIKKPRLTGWQLPENNVTLDEILSKRKNIAMRNGAGLNLLSSTSFWFMDFDHVIATGDNARSVGVAWRSGWIKKIYDAIVGICPDCFIERSLSKSGLHVFLPYIENMDVPAAWYAPDETIFGKDSVKIECWSRSTKSNQHCFVTGDVLNGHRVPTKEETAKILAMIDSCSVRSEAKPKKKQRQQHTGPRPDSIPNLGGWLEEHGVGVSRVKEQADHVLFELEVCPFDDTHRRSSFVMQYNDGGVHFDCHHHSCNHNTEEFFDTIEEGSFDLFRPKPVIDPDSNEHWDYLEQYIQPKKQRAYSADDEYWQMIENQLSLCEKEIEAQDRRMEGGYKNAK